MAVSLANLLTDYSNTYILKRSQLLQNLLIPQFNVGLIFLKFQGSLASEVHMSGLIFSFIRLATFVLILLQGPALIIIGYPKILVVVISLSLRAFHYCEAMPGCINVIIFINISTHTLVYLIQKVTPANRCSNLNY